MGMNIAGITVPEVELLAHLAQGDGRSSVMIAAELYTDADLGSNPVGLVEMTLDELCDRNLVKYRERNGVYADVRLTRPGWEFMGFNVIHHEVGRNSLYRGKVLQDRENDSMARPGEPSDWRSQPFRTTGGEIERMSLRDHMGMYPDHAVIHAAQLKEMTMGNLDVMPAIEQPATKRTFSETVEYEAKRSMKIEILQILVDKGRVEHVDEILAELAKRGRPRQDRHNVQHLLQTLRQAGYASFKEKRRGTVSMYSGIQATPAGTIRAAEIPLPDRTVLDADKAIENIDKQLAHINLAEDAITHMEESPQPPVDPPSDPEPANLGQESFPILDALLNRGLRADRLRQAAAILDGIDDDRAADLLAEADQAGQTLMDIEVEYLRYHDTHGGDDA